MMDGLWIHSIVPGSRTCAKWNSGSSAKAATALKTKHTTKWQLQVESLFKFKLGHVGGIGCPAD